jgi:hypothetical protein
MLLLGSRSLTLKLRSVLESIHSFIIQNKVPIGMDPGHAFS